MSDKVNVLQADKRANEQDRQRGGIGYVLLWMLGVPLPLLILVALLRGCA